MKINNLIKNNPYLIIAIFLLFMTATDSYLRGVIDRDLPYAKEKAERVSYVLNMILRPSDSCMLWAFGDDYGSIENYNFSAKWNKDHSDLLKLSGKELWPEEVYLIINKYCQIKE